MWKVAFASAGGLLSAWAGAGEELSADEESSWLQLTTKGFRALLS